eukprot:scaffold5843_cov28-Tisochrysis_lutea.AAC.1
MIGLALPVFSDILLSRLLLRHPTASTTTFAACTLQPLHLLPAHYKGAWKICFSQCLRVWSAMFALGQQGFNFPEISRPEEHPMGDGPQAPPKTVIHKCAVNGLAIPLTGLQTLALFALMTVATDLGGWRDLGPGGGVMGALHEVFPSLMHLEVYVEDMRRTNSAEEYLYAQLPLLLNL